MKRILLATCIVSLPAYVMANPLCGMPVSAEGPPTAAAAPLLALPQPVLGSVPAIGRLPSAEAPAASAAQPPRVEGVAVPPSPSLSVPVLRHILASGAAIQELGARDGLQMVVARSGAEFMLLSVAPSGEAAVAGIPADLSVARLREVAGAGVTEFGDRHGLRGFLVRSGDAFQVFYATPNGERVIPGVMWDATGKNLTREQVSSIEGAIPTVTIGDVSSTATQAATATPRPAAPPAARVAITVPSRGALAIAERTAAGSVGNPSAPHVWMFADPQCGYSVQAMQRLQPLVASGRVRVSVVPVAILDHQNAGRSTADSLAMLSRPAEQMVQAWSRGDLRDLPTPEAAARLRGNMEAAQSIGLRGTPTLVWRRADGSEGRQDGMPSDLDALVASMQGS